MSRELGITAARAAQWRDQFLAAGQASLKSRAPDAWDEANRRLRAKIGELLMENELLLREGRPVGGGRPFGPTEVEAMKDAHSISTRRAYGVQRVCRVWHRARSSVYTRRQAINIPGNVSAAWAGGRRPVRRADRPHPADLSRSHRPVTAKGTGKPGRSSGSRGSAPTLKRVHRFDAGARPSGPAPRWALRARSEGARRHDHHRGPRCDVLART